MEAASSKSRGPRAGRTSPFKKHQASPRRSFGPTPPLGLSRPTASASPPSRRRREIVSIVWQFRESGLMSAGCMKKVRSHLGRFGKLITLLVAFALAALSRSAAQGTRYTIVTNGPTSKRVNLAVLSEGYTTNQVSQFLTHATNLVNTLLAR